MAEVLATIKVMPDSPERDLEQLKDAIKAVIPEDAKLHEIQEEPIAFGLVALNTQVIVDDGEGGTESTEAALNDVEGIESVQVTGIGRLM